jgi:hypothetical protein
MSRLGSLDELALDIFGSAAILEPMRPPDPVKKDTMSENDADERLAEAVSALVRVQLSVLSRIDQLRQENAELRAENARLRRDLSVATTQLSLMANDA